MFDFLRAHAGKLQRVFAWLARQLDDAVVPGAVVAQQHRRTGHALEPYQADLGISPLWNLTTTEATPPSKK